MMHSDHPAYHRTRGCQHRDARRIGPDQPWLGSPCRSSSSLTIRLARESQRSTPGGPTPARSRQAVGPGALGKPILPFPSTWRFHGWLPHFRLRYASTPGRNPSSLRRFWRLPETGLPAARLSLHLRFARLVPGNLLGVFSDRAAGIAAGSFGYVFPFGFKGFPLHPPVRFPV